MAEDRLVGFDELGGGDDFKTRRVRAARQAGPWADRPADLLPGWGAQLEDHLVAAGFAEETDDGTYGPDDDEVEGLKAAVAADQGVKSSVLSLRRDMGDGM